ncbi:uncharacterized protein LOC143787812 isoform X2 [Ranitomeya variabilis]
MAEPVGRAHIIPEVQQQSESRVTVNRDPKETAQVAYRAGTVPGQGRKRVLLESCRQQGTTDQRIAEGSQTDLSRLPGLQLHLLPVHWTEAKYHLSKPESALLSTIPASEFSFNFIHLAKVTSSDYVPAKCPPESVREMPDLARERKNW